MASLPKLTGVFIKWMGVRICVVTILHHSKGNSQQVVEIDWARYYHVTDSLNQWTVPRWHMVQGLRMLPQLIACWEAHCSPSASHINPTTGQWLIAIGMSSHMHRWQHHMWPHYLFRGCQQIEGMFHFGRASWMHGFFGTSKNHLFAAGFGFAISIAIILISHVHTPVFYIVKNPKLSSFPICSSHFSKLKGLNFPHRSSLKLHKRIHRHPWRIVPSSQVWYLSQEVGKIYFHQAV